jgi:regulator of sigma E protease
MTFMQGGVPNYNSTELGTVASDSAASASGLKAGDEIVSIEGKKVTTWDSMTAIIQKHPGDKLAVVYSRNGNEKTVNVTPKEVTSSGQKIGQFGVTTSMKTGLMDKITGGFSQMATMSTALFKALGNLVTGFSLNKLGGPVMMFQLSSEAASQGLTTVIYLMALLSVNLGVVNLLPFPGFDGGKILLNIIEGIRKKPLSPEKEGMITMVGLGLIMVLMVLVTWNDISRFFLK